MTDKRQLKIVKRIETWGFATIDVLAREFNVSAQTIRRDIIHLDKCKLLHRFHGGAGVRRKTSRLGYSQKKIAQVEGKQRIGEAVAALIPDGASIFLDVGTTVEAVAQALAKRTNLQVVTNSLFAAGALAISDSIKVVVTGGLLHGADGSLVGGDVKSVLETFKFDFAVIACSGFDDDGTVMDFDIQKVDLKKVAMGNARGAILVADSTKFNRTAFVRAFALEDFSCCITDAKPPMMLETAMQKADTEVIVA